MKMGATEQLYQAIGQLLQTDLPAQKAHAALSPPNRPLPVWEQVAAFKPKLAAVAVILHQQDLLLIKRTPGIHVHASQVALPGGKYEAADADLCQTAIRETQEEIGLRLEKQFFLGQLSPLYIPPSNFWVESFVFSSFSPMPLMPNPDEVANIIQLPIVQLAQMQPIHKAINSANGPMKVPGFVFEQEFIWGATGMILSELQFIVKKIGYKFG